LFAKFGGPCFPSVDLGGWGPVVAPSDFRGQSKFHSLDLRVGDRAVSPHGASRVERRTKRTTSSFSAILLCTDSVTPVASRPVGVGTNRRRVLVPSGLPLASFEAEHRARVANYSKHSNRQTDWNGSATCVVHCNFERRRIIVPTKYHPSNLAIPLQWP
jgi:hypothetical protein